MIRKIALVGHPNTGKTTLFNLLTNSQCAVGNWAGVTVDISSGYSSFAEGRYQFIDLPGCYSCQPHHQGQRDERVTQTYLSTETPDLILQVLDSRALEQQLLLSQELTQLGIPLLLVINTMHNTATCDVQPIARAFGCRVLQGNVTTPTILKTLQEALEQPYVVPYAFPQDITLMLEQARTLTTSTQISVSPLANHWLDNFCLHPVLGLPIFLGIMYGMFFCAIKGGSVFQDFFGLGTQGLIGYGLSQLLPSSCQWIIDGISLGMGTTAAFIPVIGIMFFCLTWIENSGYIARAAFVVDRIMSSIGLPGKSFVPLVIGLGCNVPAVLSTRTIDDEKARILTIMMSPFMSCGARLAIYTVFVATFFPQNGQNVIFLLYFLGITTAVITGKILRLTILPTQKSGSVIEFPVYRRPALSLLLRVTGHKITKFIKKATFLIVPLCLLLSVLHPPGYTETPLTSLGKKISPIFAPMGIQQDNWPATVGLFTGILAKEVVVGTLKTLYENETTAVTDYPRLLTEATLSVRNNIKTFNLSPLSYNQDEAWHGSQEMQERFGSQAAAMAYLIFILLYVPCVSVLAVISKEVNTRWALFSLSWNTGLAYLGGTFCYQLLTYRQHPYDSTLWLFMCIIIFLSILGILKNITQKKGRALPVKIRLNPS